MRAEVHQRRNNGITSPAKSRSGSPAEPVQHSRDVDVDGKIVESEREGTDRSGRVRADSRQSAQLLGIAWNPSAVLADDDACDFVQAHRTSIVSEATPGTQDVRASRRSERCQRRESHDEGFKSRHDPLDLRLLQHELAYERPIRAAFAAPRQAGAAAAPVPSQ